jgi:hypothetical protein
MHATPGDPRRRVQGVTPAFLDLDKGVTVVPLSRGAARLRF